MAKRRLSSIRKRFVDILIEGAYMTEDRQQQVGQAIMIALMQQLDGETGGVTISFKEQEDF